LAHDSLSKVEGRGSKFQKAELTLRLIEIETFTLADARTDLGKTLCSNEPEVGRARDTVAKKVGLSPITFQRAVTIIQRAPEDLKEKVRRGEVSISYAYEMLRRRERPNTPPLPEGVRLMCIPIWNAHTCFPPLQEV